MRPPPKSIFNVTTLGNTLVATCSIEELTVDSESGYRGTASWVPMAGGKASTATAAPTAAEITASARAGRSRVPTRRCPGRAESWWSCRTSDIGSRRGGQCVGTNLADGGTEQSAQLSSTAVKP
jgi:hypothetical protein